MKTRLSDFEFMLVVDALRHFRTNVADQLADKLEKIRKEEENEQQI